MIGSVASVKGFPGFGVYAASKAAHRRHGSKKALLGCQRAPDEWGYSDDPLLGKQMLLDEKLDRRELKVLTDTSVAAVHELLGKSEILGIVRKCLK